MRFPLFLQCIFASGVCLSASTDPRSSLASFEVNDKLAVELVAAEPLIASPVSIAFDEHGRLFVAEMIDYPYDQEKLIGRVTLLTDTNGDGIFDTRSTYADKLSWPSGIACWDGGVYVAATPHIWYLKDSDGDGVADIRRIAFTGFGTTRRAADMVVNGFVWGLDNRFHGATSVNHGLVRPGAQPDAKPLDLAGKDFSWNPKDENLRAESGGSQFGITFDSFGRKYVTNASFPSMVMYDYRYAGLNPQYELPQVLFRIFADRTDSEVYRISPEEEWRILRTQSRLAGKTVGPTEGGRPSGFVTAGAGVTIFRGSGLPPEFDGNLFMGEPSGNLVIRKLLVPNGVPFVVKRAAEELKAEVLRSKELTFRPVNFANGPDGALYIADIHRDLIEDVSAIPEEIRQKTKIDPVAGRYTGRIYRLASKDRPAAMLPSLAEASDSELVRSLESKDGWRRDTAARLLFIRQPKGVAASVRTVLDSSSLPEARVHALSVLEGFGELDAPAILRGLKDANEAVVELAIQFGERWLARQSASPQRDDIQSAILELAASERPRIRYQAILSAAQLPRTPKTRDVLYRALTDANTDRWIQVAALNSSGDAIGELTARALASGLTNSPAGRALILEMLGIVGARNKPDETKQVVALLGKAPDVDFQLGAVNALGKGLKRANASLQSADSSGALKPVFERAANFLRDRAASDEARVAATELVAQDSTTPDQLFYSLLTPGETRRVLTAAIDALAARNAPRLAEELTSRWPAFAAPVRQDALRVLMLRPERMKVLLEAIKDRKVRRSDLSATQVQQLSRNSAVSALAAEVFQAAKNRQQVIDRYAVALTLPADPKRGRQVFMQSCAACHKLGNEGFDLGPDLMGVRGHGKEGNLIAIFDPNRKVDPTYTFFEVETNKGDVFTGAISSESATAITLKQPQGDTVTIPRNTIKNMTSHAQSLMPEGLEAMLTPQNVADLLEYIMTAEATN